MASMCFKTVAALLAFGLLVTTLPIVNGYAVIARIGFNHLKSSNILSQSVQYVGPSSISPKHVDNERIRFLPRKSKISTLSASISNEARSESLDQANAIVTSNTWDDDTYSYRPIFDFSIPGTVDKIERLDDAIMGGISTSSVQPVIDKPYARWTGVCRTDGGGFCGFRTNSFAEPLMVDSNVNGFYIKCRLASDNEPNRRVWKLTTRTKPDRGELLYQAPFNLTNVATSNNNDIVFMGYDDDDDSTNNKWCTVLVPFHSFRLVRGPRVIENGPPLNTTTGLYQIGMTMSKFIFNSNTTVLENFRDGFFELQLKEIGLYTDKNEIEPIIRPPIVYTKDEAKKNRPFLVKVLLPISKLFFSESSNRRKSAMRILMTERNMTRIQAINFGLKLRAKSSGIVKALTSIVSIMLMDAFRAVLFTTLRIVLIYPIMIAARIISLIRRNKKQPPKTVGHNE